MCGGMNPFFRRFRASPSTLRLSKICPTDNLCLMRISFPLHALNTTAIENLSCGQALANGFIFNTHVGDSEGIVLDSRGLSRQAKSPGTGTNKKRTWKGSILIPNLILGNMVRLAIHPFLLTTLYILLRKTPSYDVLSDSLYMLLPLVFPPLNM